jgi:predicted O-methyltransferase YrrM
MRAIEVEAPKRGLPIIGPGRGVILDEVVMEYSPATILEVGTLVGYSAIRMGRHIKPGGKLTCVEINEDIAKVARSNIQKAGLSDRIEVRVGDAKKVLVSLAGRFDMVFLDAAKDEYLSYLRLIEPRLHKGSVVLADNVKSHAVELADYLRYVRASGKYRSTYREAPSNYGTDEGDAVEISVTL